MFRNVVRKKQALEKEECLEIIKNTKRGVLSVIEEDGYPYGMPINHFYNEDDGKIYFHGGKQGHRVDALKKNNKASFCVLQEPTKSDEGWWLVFKSVIVFGRIEFIEDEEKIIDICRKLSYQFTDDENYIENEIKVSAQRTLLFALTPEWITGKRVNEK